MQADKGQGCEEKKVELYQELFAMCKINLVVHNTNTSKETGSGQYVASDLTNFILGKIKQQGEEPWNLLSKIPALIEQILSDPKTKQTYHTPTTDPKDLSQLPYKLIGSVHFQNPSTVYIGTGTQIQHGALITGPCLIAPNCQIRKGAYIRGNALIGPSTLIGNSCEIKNAILLDNCQIAHYNYIGDSVLGMGAHFSAGAITSNYKLDGSEIRVGLGNGSGAVGTGRNKLGALVGHHVEIGCNAILNPGSIIGRNSVIYPLVNWRGYLPSNKICKLAQQQQVIQRR